MERGGTSRLAAVLGVVLLVTVGAGCAAIDATTSTTTTAPGTDNGTDEIHFPDPPASLTPETARETATQYHMALLAQRLAGTGSDATGLLPPRAAVETRVVNRSGGGYYAVVSLPNGSLQDRVPHFSRAMYVLREGTNPRSAYPLPSRDVDTYIDPGQSLHPVDLRIANFRRGETTMSVVITRVGTTSETAYLDTLEVPARTGRVLADPIAAAGQYRVTVTTENRSASQLVTLAAGEPARPIGIYLDPDGHIEIRRGP
jgi:hypothetical protein